MNSSATLKAEGALQLDGKGVLVRLSVQKGGKEDLTMWQARSSLSYLLFKGRLGGLVEIKGLKALATSLHLCPHLVIGSVSVCRKAHWDFPILHLCSS